MGQYIYLIYATLSIIIVGLVILRGVGWKSNYLPQDKDVDREKRSENKTKKETGKGGEADVSTD